ncbi:uncharacterized protein EV154DRAFT_483789 [Mucor mucedo]|uniref:uncharacterized protein n=1 Tax=Mucor mucedo TaxID=29922 RepID=UPI00221EC6FF|nr:uncharacterized protein EV154DRAFT_483789 [Mucor mucedo]KAI7888724.1 hypothetical protein EV154DRAFT_483789 [Mucor mucedo]
MISLLKFVCLLSVLQIIQAYCVYNRLSNSTVLPSFINVYAVNRTLNFHINIAASNSSFKATLIGYDSKACCPFSERTCNPYGSLVYPILLNFELSFDGKVTPIKPGAACDAGGGLAFYGTQKSFYAECTSPNGTVSPVSILNLEVYNAIGTKNIVVIDKSITSFSENDVYNTPVISAAFHNKTFCNYNKYNRQMTAMSCSQTHKNGHEYMKH